MNLLKYNREILSEVFLAAPSESSATSALYVGWGLLVGFDMVLNRDNASEPYPIECNNPPITDVWCPAGSQSEDIPFHRCVCARAGAFVLWVFTNC